MSAWPRSRWYLARLQAMSASELRARATRAVRSYADDVSSQYVPTLWRRTWEPADERLFGMGPLLDRPLGLLDHEGSRLVRSEAPAEARAIVARAERLLAGRIRYFDYPEVQLSFPPDYSLDLVTGRSWPKLHTRRIDYRTATVGDPKWIWELNRLQDLPLLALGWRLSGSETFAEAAAARMQSWIGSSSPGSGIAWSNGFEPALRAISLAFCHDALRGSPFLPTTAARATLRALWQHATYALRELSLSSSANNHLVGELAGIAVVGLLAPELRDADHFVAAGFDGLAREADRQILPDGMGAEQAFAYQLFVVDLILLVVAVSDRRGVSTPPELRAALERTAGAIAVLLAENEPEPRFGDSDDGRAFIFDAEEARSARRVAASLAAAIGHRGVRRVAGTIDPAALLLFGDAGRKRFLETAADDEPGDALLSDSGIVIMRRSGTRTTVDIGPLGYLAIAAHGHADALSVCISHGAADLVVDPGTGSYFGDPARRVAFRGTAAHATVTVDGCDQTEQAGPFIWRRHYQTTLRHFDSSCGVVVAEHDGYLRLADPVLHRRTVVALDGGVLVVDRLEAAGRHSYVQSWPLDASLEPACADRIVTALRDGVPAVAIAAAATSGGGIRLSRSAFSRRLEHAEPSWTAELTVECSGPVSMVALLAIAQTPAWRDPELHVSDDGSTTQTAFLLNGVRTLADVPHRNAAGVRIAIAATDQGSA